MENKLKEDRGQARRQSKCYGSNPDSHKVAYVLEGEQWRWRNMVRFRK